MKKKFGHGGVRIGAGKKKLPDNLKKINLCGKVKPATNKWVKSKDETVGVVMDGLVEFFQKNN